MEFEIGYQQRGQKNDSVEMKWKNKNRFEWNGSNFRFI